MMDKTGEANAIERKRQERWQYWEDTYCGGVMDKTEMKPSTRIYQLIGETRSDPEWQEKAIKAIIDFLDEQYERSKDGKK